MYPDCKTTHHGIAWQGNSTAGSLGVIIQDVVCGISTYFLVRVFHEKVKEIAEWLCMIQGLSGSWKVAKSHGILDIRVLEYYY